MSRLIRSIRFQSALTILTAALLTWPAQAVMPMRVVRPPVIPSAGVHGFGMPMMRAPQAMRPIDPFMRRGIPPTAARPQSFRPVDPGIFRSNTLPPGFTPPTVHPHPMPALTARVPPPAPAHRVVRALPPTAARTSFFQPTPFSSLNLFPRPFGIVSNPTAAALVGANIPPQVALDQGFFMNPFLAAGFGFNPFMNSGFDPFFGTGFNPVLAQTGFNASLAGFPFAGATSPFFSPAAFTLAATRPNIAAGLASGNPQVVANALGTLARHPNLFNTFANANPFLIAGALGTLSGSPNSFTGLVATNPLINNAFSAVASNPNLLGSFVNANPFVFANAAFNPTLFNTLANANPAVANTETLLSLSPLISPVSTFGAVNGFASPFWGGFGGGGYNPYLSSLYAGGYGLGGYGMGGYGGGGGGYGGGSASPTYSAMQAQDYINQAQAAEKPRESTNLLTAYGVPNDEGRIQWPVGLRVLGPATTTDPMRQRIDSLVTTLLGQKYQYGHVDVSIVQETTHAVDALRRQLAERSTDLSFLSYQDSRNFLAHLQDALKKLE